MRCSESHSSFNKMRQIRSKAYRKLMAMYSTSFGFRQPYQVLVDSEMCETAVSQKIDFLARIESVLVGSVKLSECSSASPSGINDPPSPISSAYCPSGTSVITQCCIHELYIRGKSHQPAVDLAKSFERRKCNHKEAIPGNECIASVVGETNKHRYVIATQSHPLRVSLRAIPGVPIVHINRSVMVLEPASDATLQSKQRAEHDALGPSKSEKVALNAVTPQVELVVKRKKRPKGPNPLSVKKKASNTTRVEKADVVGKRKRQGADGHWRCISSDTIPNRSEGVGTRPLLYQQRVPSSTIVGFWSYNNL
ncbi:PIN domain-like protein [Russula emetica]|nr:PIN domain-like protein [Russula emetica]